MTKKKRTDSDPRWTSDLQPAPGDLRIVQAFLNTACIRQSADPASPRVLAEALERWGLVAPGTGLGEDDLEELFQVRGALWSLLAHGQAVSGTAVGLLDRAMTSALVRVRFGAGGRMRLEPAPAGFDGTLAKLVSILVRAEFDGTLSQMKVCVGSTCRAVFFDFSKSGRTKWCSPRCCSRSSSLAYRHRNLETVRKKDRGHIMHRRLNR